MEAAGDYTGGSDSPFATRLARVTGERRLVRKGGFEPPRYCYRQPLKLVRLPVPPLPRGWARATELWIALTTRVPLDTANPQYIRPIQTTTTSRGSAWVPHRDSLYRNLLKSGC